jgi:hypothetical protein
MAVVMVYTTAALQLTTIQQLYCYVMLYIHTTLHYRCWALKLANTVMTPEQITENIMSGECSKN